MGNGIFTRNYDNAMAILKMPRNTTSIYTGSKFGDGDLSMKAYDGSLTTEFTKYSSNTSTHYLPLTLFSVTASKSNGNTSYIFLGSNNTEETYDDTNLVSELSQYNTASAAYDLTYFTPVIDAAVYDEETDCFKRTIHYTWVANSACTVGEMGFYWGTSYIFNNPNVYLVYRRAFETPYELEANDTFKLDFTVIIPANPNKPATTEVETSVE